MTELDSDPRMRDSQQQDLRPSFPCTLGIQSPKNVWGTVVQVPKPALNYCSEN